MVMKPVALLPWSLHSAPLRRISPGAGSLPIARFLQADPLLYSPLADLSRKCALGLLLDCFGKLRAPLSRVLSAGLSLGSLALRSFRLSPAFLTTTASADFCRALARQISPSKVFNVSTHVVGLYLLRLSVTVGFRIP
jgi:hypothetical protein